ncbi:glycoside hydrolase family 65 protein [Paenibacillus sp. FSL H7-0703]|uniref:glycoside hydrolase family 65 protein n=1 Tax=Paenibacillus sp. FSL H7-0703 TaxID=2921438 RepID=UPI0030F7ED05
MVYNRLFDVDSWKLTTHTLHSTHMRLQESITSIGNGYMGMRGNFEEAYSGDHHQGTYISGVWFPDKTKVGWWKNGYPEYFGKVINAMNFIGIRLIVNQEEVDLFTAHISDFVQELDMKQGILRRTCTVNDQVRITTERFLSITTRELCLIDYQATNISEQPLTIELIPYLDGNTKNEDTNYDEVFWLEEAREVQEQFISLSTTTIDNPFGIPRFTVNATMGIVTEGQDLQTTEESFLYAARHYQYSVAPGDSIQLQKIVAVTTSRDMEKDALIPQAERIAVEAVNKGYTSLKQEHVAAWARRWDKADVEIEGDTEAQQGIRFNIFQLFSTYYGEDARLNIGPKGFTGEKYGGATYWDTEAYAVPMYLALADPDVTRNLLLYRHQQLEGAKHNAAQQGLRGALYPMVTFTGVECHNEWEITFEEIHRNGAIAYAIYNYTNYTGDLTYLHDYGVDVLVEISRFWADRVHFSKSQQQYMIHGVTGPNEYENNVNNNWYTNTLAAWVLKYTLSVLPQISTEKAQRLAVTADELAHWQDIVTHMYYPYDEEREVFVQHDTFMDKDLQPVSALDPSNLPLNQKWSWDKILRSCFIKQADVLQGLYFFGDQFTLEEKARNFAFYEPMTVHESSLSPSIHAVLAAELKMEEKAVEMYKRTARLDLDNYNNDTEDGLHITSMTGSWLAIVQGFAGMRTYNETLSFSPFLPQDWTKYTFKINYRGRLLSILVQENEVIITLLDGEPLTLELYGQPTHITSGQPLMTNSVS